MCLQLGCRSKISMGEVLQPQDAYIGVSKVVEKLSGTRPHDFQELVLPKGT